MRRYRPDLPGMVFGSVALLALFGLPFVIEKANRIVPGVALPLSQALSGGALLLLMAACAVPLLYAALTRRAALRGLAAAVAVVAIAYTLGAAATALSPLDNHVVRIAPGVGCWLALAAAALLVIDAVAQLQLPALRRLVLLALALAVLMAGLVSGHFDHVSMWREYLANADRFAHECNRHLLLSVGSLVAAVSVGLPLGLASFHRPRWRQAILTALNLVQTIPSIALYGILMAPLAALVVAFPSLAALGIGGIGYAPAFIALFLYALLPIVANTVLGLLQVDAAVIEAARGMGLTAGQVLVRVRWPLALPTILTGIRVVLVQNIGLAAVAALVGGGGLGTFIFQGIGQTATDLVLLGALPTVALALVAGVVLDALVELLERRRPA
jgi:osmoprotectant transport system permease protein